MRRGTLYPLADAMPRWRPIRVRGRRGRLAAARSGGGAQRAPATSSTPTRSAGRTSRRPRRRRRPRHRPPRPAGSPARRRRRRRPHRPRRRSPLRPARRSCRAPARTRGSRPCSGWPCCRPAWRCARMLGEPASVTASPEETERAGAALAAVLAPGDVVLVSGELGAGKTTFVRGAARALGVTEPVTSPTFVVGHLYDGAGGRAPRPVPARRARRRGPGAARPLLRRPTSSPSWSGPSARARGAAGRAARGAARRARPRGRRPAAAGS